MTTVRSRRLAVLLLLAALLLLLTPLAARGAAARPARPARPAARHTAVRVLGPGRAHEPGFSGYVTEGGAALGVARLPDGRFGVCIDTGGRHWPSHRGQSAFRPSPVVGYLASRYLPTAHRDAVTAIALWWAVGLDLHLNSGQRIMRSHLATLRRESPVVYRRARRRHDQMLGDARSHASTHGYTALRPRLATDGRIQELGVRGAQGRLLPGVRVSLHLAGATLPGGRHAWSGAVPTSAAAAPRWHRDGGGAVHLVARYAGVPASGFVLVRSGRASQRAVVSAGVRTLTQQARRSPLPRPRLHTTASAARVEVGARLEDTVVVSGAAHARLRGRWRLLGPVLPAVPAGTDRVGCGGIDWSDAPDASAGTFAAAGDGSYRVGATTLRSPGCYTYVERLTSSAATRATRWTPTGMAAETSLVLARPGVATTVSRTMQTAGGRLSDRVQVSGLPAGASAPLLWRLLGPVAPRGGRCHGVSWRGAPVRARGTTVADASGSTTVGPTTVGTGGCYTYQERLEAGPLSVATSWTTAGVAAESSAVRPRAPRIPRHPQVDTGGSRRSRAAGRAARTGARVRVGRVGMTSAVAPIRFRSGRLTPPSLRLAGWWTGGADLDALVGTTVIAGHVSDDRDRHGPFARLEQVRTGDVVTTTSADGAIQRWRVTKRASYDRRHLPRRLFDQRVARKLELITCTDELRGPGGSFHYRRNLVITAVPVG